MLYWEFLKKEPAHPFPEGGRGRCQSIVKALDRACGPVLCRIEGDGESASLRWCLKESSGEDLLREFARRCALDVTHLWDPPEPVAEYLRTGSEELRPAAELAAWEAIERAAGPSVSRKGRAVGTIARAVLAASSAIPPWEAARSAAEAAVLGSCTYLAGGAAQDSADASARYASAALAAKGDSVTSTVSDLAYKQAFRAAFETSYQQAEEALLERQERRLAAMASSPSRRGQRIRFAAREGDPPPSRGVGGRA